jgi:acyl-[acyl-carrier-protein]-phospholipid O-acyltransferase/long-chain-fatty-acid--[acyl-carrier-protein] ligase
MAVAFAGGIFILPFFLFSTIAGQMADRFNKDRITRWIKFAEILIMGIGAYGFYKNSAAILLWVLFLMGTHSTFFGPIKYGILPDHLEKKELLFGNAFIEASTFIAILIGTVFGSLLILKAGGVAIISVVLLVVAKGGYVSSFFIPIARGHEGVRIGLNIIRESYRLIKDVRQTSGLMKTIMGISWFWFMGATWVAVVPSYVKDILGSGENIVTLFFTLFAVGIGVGSILCNFILKGELTSKYVPVAGLGLTVATLSFVQISKIMNGGAQGLHNLLSFGGVGIACSLFGVGVFGGLFTVPLYSLLQYWSKPKHRARNIAVNNVINAFFMILKFNCE